MTTQAIINGINDYLLEDCKYKFEGKRKDSGSITLYESVTFDMVNKKPQNHFAPYFPIQSITQAKNIFKSVIPEINDKKLDDLFYKVLASKKLDFSKKLYFSIFRPNRI